MKYYIDDNTLSLTELQKRIENTDLVPSRQSLTQNINSVFETLAIQKIKTVAELRNTLKTPKKISEFAKSTNLDENYLILLRREIESYFPKTYKLSDFPHLPAVDCEILASEGFDTTKKVFENLYAKEKCNEVCERLNLNSENVRMILSFSDLSRIQWVSPLFAFMLYSAGYKTARDIAKANPDILHKEIDEINENGKYFNGKIGLRDIKRLIHSAKFLT